MRSLVLAFTLGVFGLQQQSELSPVLIYAFGLAVLAIFGVFAWHHHTSASKVAAVKAIEQFSWKTTAIQLLFGFVFGWCWAGSFAHYRLGESLAPNVVGKDFEVTGVITSLPTRSPQGWHFQFTRDGDHENSTEVLLHIPKKLAVSWLDHPQNPPQFSTLQPGQRWHLNLRVKPVHGNANPYGFDYEAWMLEQGLRANASVHSNSEQAGTAKAKLIDEFVWSLSNVVERGRSSLRDRLHLALGGSNNTAYAGVLIALVIGDQSEISQANWTLFNRTGIGHLVSISGLHITMIAGMFASCFGFLWRRSFYFGRDWPLLIPVRKVMVLSAALAALVYVALAGFGVPAQRTLCMLTVVALAVWTGRSSNMSQVLCLALCTVLLFDPWAVLWSGFWLSFAAVAVLLYVGEAATIDRKSVV